MGLRQWIVIVLMIALNALDGFDVSSSAFAAPGLSKEWGVPRNCGYWSIMTGAWCSCSTRA